MGSVGIFNLASPFKFFSNLGMRERENCHKLKLIKLPSLSHCFRLQTGYNSNLIFIFPLFHLLSNTLDRKSFLFFNFSFFPTF